MVNSGTIANNDYQSTSNMIAGSIKCWSLGDNHIITEKGYQMVHLVTAISSIFHKEKSNVIAGRISKNPIQLCLFDLIWFTLTVGLKQ